MTQQSHLAKTILLTGFFISSFFYLGLPQAQAAETECKMNFNMKSWSAFYKSGKGSGRIHCDNGQTARVYLRSQGGGLTFGKRKVIGGQGNFTKVSSIKELYGSYAMAEAHAGAGGSANAQALTKGEVSLTLTGTGKGVDLGFDFGKFTISKR